MKSDYDDGNAIEEFDWAPSSLYGWLILFDLNVGYCQIIPTYIQEVGSSRTMEVLATIVLLSSNVVNRSSIGPQMVLKWSSKGLQKVGSKLESLISFR